MVNARSNAPLQHGGNTCTASLARQGKPCKIGNKWSLERIELCHFSLFTQITVGRNHAILNSEDWKQSLKDAEKHWTGGSLAPWIWIIATETPRELLSQLCLHHHMPSSPSAVSTSERIASTMDYYSLRVRFIRFPNVSSKRRPQKIYDIGHVACPGKNTSRDPVKVFRRRNHLAEEGDAITGVDSSMLRHPGIRRP